jgi:hypothetical protein
MNPGHGEAPFAQPQPGSIPARPAVARAMTFARVLSAKAGLVALVVIAAELAMPPEFKPSFMLGKFHGSIDAAEILAKQEEQVEFERRLAETRAIAAANAQIEQQLAAQQQQAIAESLQAQSAIANLADSGCVMGTVLNGLFGEDESIRKWGNALQSACGVGDQVRAGIAGSLAGAIRDNSGVVPVHRNETRLCTYAAIGMAAICLARTQGCSVL